MRNLKKKVNHSDNELIDVLIFKYRNGEDKPRRIYRTLKDKNPNTDLGSIVDEAGSIVNELYAKERKEK